jgi:hypothetical protein
VKQFICRAALGLSLAFYVHSVPLLADEYYPPAGKWEPRAPEAMGFDAEKFQTALNP